MLNVDCHGGKSVILAAYASSSNALSQYAAEQGIRVLFAVLENFWFAEVSSEWFLTNFSAQLNQNKAIVIWSSCKSANDSIDTAVMDAAGGRWKIGYWDITTEKENQLVNELFLKRMNGAKDSANKRTAGDAWGKIQNKQNDYEYLGKLNVRMRGNDWTTLCPAPMAADEVWPPDQTDPGRRYGFGCVIFDTYMNHSISASEALIKVSGGPTYDHRWVPSKHGKFILGFEYDKTDGTAIEMRAVGAKCNNVGHDDGRRMDGNRMAPNDTDAVPENKEWSY